MVTLVKLSYLFQILMSYDELIARIEDSSLYLLGMLYDLMSAIIHIYWTVLHPNILMKYSGQQMGTFAVSWSMTTMFEMKI